jgi:Predicted integral membrane protein (DUF2189)
MATSYQSHATPQGNVTSLTQSGQAAGTVPDIRTIGLSDLHRALQLGWEDFKAVPSHAIILCAIYPVLGLVLARFVHGYAVLPLLFPLAAGFALLGPFAALGLYEMSRRREHGEAASAWDAMEVFGSPSFGAMLGLGTLLFALFVTWIATAQAIYVAVFGYLRGVVPDDARPPCQCRRGDGDVAARGCPQPGDDGRLGPDRRGAIGFGIAAVLPGSCDRHSPAGPRRLASLSRDHRA